MGRRGGAERDQEGGTAARLQATLLQRSHRHQVIGPEGGGIEGTTSELGGKALLKLIDADQTSQHLGQGFREHRRERGLEAAGGGQQGTDRQTASAVLIGIGAQGIEFSAHLGEHLSDYIALGSCERRGQRGQNRGQQGAALDGHGAGLEGAKIGSG